MKSSELIGEEPNRVYVATHEMSPGRIWLEWDKSNWLNKEILHVCLEGNIQISVAGGPGLAASRTENLAPGDIAFIPVHHVTELMAGDDGALKASFECTIDVWGNQRPLGLWVWRQSKYDRELTTEGPQTILDHPTLGLTNLRIRFGKLPAGTRHDLGDQAPGTHWRLIIVDGELRDERDPVAIQTPLGPDQVIGDLRNAGEHFAHYVLIELRLFEGPRSLWSRISRSLGRFVSIIFLLIRDTPSEEVYVLNMFRMRGSRI